MDCPRVTGRWLASTELVRTVRRMSPALVSVFVVHFFASYSYHIVTAVLVQFLSRNLGLDDTQASLVYSMFGMLITLDSVVFGMIVDQVSIFSSALAGAFVGLVGKLLLLLIAPTAVGDATTWSLGWAIFVMSTLVPLGETMLGQTVGIGVKRYATPDPDAIETETLESFPGGRGTAHNAVEYSLSYSLHNVSALLAYMTIALANAATTDEAVVNRVALIASLPSLVIVAGVALIALHKYDTFDIDAAVAQNYDTDLADESRARELEAGDTSSGRCRRLWRYGWVTRNLFTGPVGRVFMRFLVVSLLLMGAKSLFRHTEATLPKYTQRAFDPLFSYATLLMVNPALVIVITTPVQSLLKRYETLPTIIGGTIVCALSSLFFMVRHPVAAYIGAAAFTVGEVIWTPRLVDYAFQLAPRGKEGAFGAAVTIPLFFAKLPVGLMSGALLETYCPAWGQCNGVALWALIAAFGATSPVGLLLAYRWLTAIERRHQNTRKFVAVNSSDSNSDEDSETYMYRRGNKPRPIKLQPIAMPWANEEDQLKRILTPHGGGTNRQATTL